MGQLTGRKALITGAGSGIGRKIAQRFAREGAELIVVGRDELKLQDTLSNLTGHHKMFCADIASVKDVKRLAAYTKQHFTTLDILVNNAGTIIRNEKIEQTDYDEWQSFMAINVGGTFLMCKYLIPLMKEKGGSIVNVSSQLAVVSAPGYSTYSTAKGAILAFTRSLAIDYGALGIRANVLLPGVTETPMAYVGREQFDDIKAAIAETIPLRRIGKPEDIANAALFLASDESSWMTGSPLIVDGGYTAK